MCKVNYAVQRDESGKGGGQRILLENTALYGLKH